MSYNTNLAAEFHVLSLLHRLGYSAYLTLGNKKSVDIIVEVDGKIITVDVKGMMGSTSWPTDNLPLLKKGHFIVLVTFKGRMEDPSFSPECYVLDIKTANALRETNPGGNRNYISYSKVRGSKHLQNWDILS
ncbi:MAG: hypothetical protein ACK5XV_09535 [Flavobacteriales bacterium]|jgi:hypothetical protein